MESGRDAGAGGEDGSQKAEVGSKKQEARSGIKEMLAGISVHVFRDPVAEFAALAYDLGLTYERLGAQRRNASLDFFLFREKWEGVFFATA